MSVSRHKQVGLIRLPLERYFSLPLFRNIPSFFSKHTLIKHTCSRRDKLIVLWTMNKQAKKFLRIWVSPIWIQDIIWILVFARYALSTKVWFAVETSIQKVRYFAVIIWKTTWNITISRNWKTWWKNGVWFSYFLP